jgi:hypothetical protein
MYKSYTTFKIERFSYDIAIGIRKINAKTRRTRHWRPSRRIRFAAWRGDHDLRTIRADNRRWFVSSQFVDTDANPDDGTTLYVVFISRPLLDKCIHSCLQKVVWFVANADLFAVNTVENLGRFEQAS